MGCFLMMMMMFDVGKKGMTHSLTDFKTGITGRSKETSSHVDHSNNCTGEGKGSLSFSCLLLSSFFFVAPGTGNEPLFLRFTVSHTNPSLDFVFHGNEAETDEGSETQTSLSLSLSFSA